MVGIPVGLDLSQSLKNSVSSRVRDDKYDTKGSLQLSLIGGECKLEMTVHWYAGIFWDKLARTWRQATSPPPHPLACVDGLIRQLLT